MQKTKKQLLGLAGLAAVGVMTAVAYAMPNAASAYTNGTEETGNHSGDINLNVTVRAGVAQAKLKSPANNSYTTSEIVPVVYTYEESEYIETFLEYKNADGGTASTMIDRFVPTEVYGEHQFELNLSKYGLNDRQYKIIVRSYNEKGTMNEDTVVFSYRSRVVEPSEKPEENGDPVIDVDVSEDVDKVYVQVFDKDNNSVLIDKDGKPVVIVVDSKDVDPDTGKLLIKLPFEEYGVEDGDYTVVITAKDKDGNTISMVTTDVTYKFTAPDTPETPNTGSVLDDLNITRADYVITGLIVFGLVAGFALYLVGRKSRR